MSVESNNRYYGKNPWMRTLASIKFRCSCKKNKYYKKGIKNFLTKEQIRSLWFRDKAWLLKQPSIDRIDSKGNYELDNCRFIEHWENSRRNSLPLQKIKQYDLNGNLIKEWDSIYLARKTLKLNKGHIWRALVRGYSLKGFKYRFVEERGDMRKKEREYKVGDIVNIDDVNHIKDKIYDREFTNKTFDRAWERKKKELKKQVKFKIIELFSPKEKGKS